MKLMCYVVNRIMVGLPSVDQRETIMKTLLSKESVSEGLDFREIANMTEGFSGSDLKVIFSFLHSVVIHYPNSWLIKVLS